MKTNKSFSKRLKLTRRGKLVGRRPGQNHFNAKESRSGQMAGKRSVTFELNRKGRNRFLPGFNK
ncbi:hypothetical protein A3D66_02780 [Candidatus Kaiserbacteria bacterium RIFCSPHIGHO2_02_FULL_50_9]|uniref:50S ribosomal protein L35 n=1 Tax=Candidatus Kaiserbacteria bacterium RIFCSPLOWO2_01_FULL_51_21 TaxID=1798508 RepID=A0A1F6ECP5_9BACT|nr:MAG: hypothetical protein A2761_01160 [Candidatus Kaiserbacteria bacterium RIFCSPHIGHO2_01_FULL_51_33]OGG63342.1 MAG: hypothetical protein A3D66_02780 [Candidatus Kaiserbacteria bacterium RIFCSPHIGHO2_02_FULL_50_9]OGG71370.1 MAG: hypothetical protein A3A35_01315 [Candidatus Kaiserbacteria bacterium RIFCSPLOWO2_01_FULL_51_21]